jgi:plastocyanin
VYTGANGTEAKPGFTPNPPAGFTVDGENNTHNTTFPNTGTWAVTCTDHSGTRNTLNVTVNP